MVYSFHGIGTTTGKDNSGRITVAFWYNPDLVPKVKSIFNHKWRPAEKHWNFPDTNGALEKILNAFKGEEITWTPQNILSPLVGEGKGGGISKTFADNSFKKIQLLMKIYAPSATIIPYRVKKHSMLL